MLSRTRASACSVYSICSVLTFLNFGYVCSCVVWIWEISKTGSMAPCLYLKIQTHSCKKQREEGVIFKIRWSVLPKGSKCRNWYSWCWGSKMIDTDKLYSVRTVHQKIWLWLYSSILYNDMSTVNTLTSNYFILVNEFETKKMVSETVKCGKVCSRLSLHPKNHDTFLSAILKINNSKYLIYLFLHYIMF